MATTRKTTDGEVLVIPAIETKEAIITVVGDTPLIVHAWDEKAKKIIKDKEAGAPKTKGHEKRDPFAEFIDSMYWLSGKPENKTPEGFQDALENGATFGFPSKGIKAAAVSAGYRAGITKNKVVMNGAFHIDSEFIQIDGVPEYREDMVTVGNGAADIRYRGWFPEWSATFQIRYNSGVTSLPELANLFNYGGFACGIGENRIERGGSNGAFHVATI